MLIIIMIQNIHKKKLNEILSLTNDSNFGNDLFKIALDVLFVHLELQLEFVHLVFVVELAVVYPF